MDQMDFVELRRRSVRQRLKSHLSTAFHLKPEKADEVAELTVGWLRRIGRLPGQMLVAVPATSAKKLAKRKRKRVRIMMVEPDEDLPVWNEYGVGKMRRRRILRWMMEIYRGGGWASQTEVAGWTFRNSSLNTDAFTFLRSIQKVGKVGVPSVWVPYVGNATEPEPGTSLPWEAWVLNRCLKENEGGDIGDKYRKSFGLTNTCLNRLIGLCKGVASEFDNGEEETAVAKAYLRSVLEVNALRKVAEIAKEKGTWPERWKRPKSARPVPGHFVESLEDAMGNAMGKENQKKYLRSLGSFEWPALGRLTHCALSGDAHEPFPVVTLALNPALKDVPESKEAPESKDDAALEDAPEPKDASQSKDAPESQDDAETKRPKEFGVRSQIACYARQADEQGVRLDTMDLAFLMGVRTGTAAKGAEPREHSCATCQGTKTAISADCLVGGSKGDRVEIVFGPEEDYRLEGHYYLVKIEGIHPSHDRAGFTRTRGVHSAVQARNLETDRVARETYQQRAGRFDHRAVTDLSSYVQLGPPVVRRDGIVVAGHKRAMLIQLVAEKSKKKYEAYKRHIEKQVKKERLAVDTAALGEYKYMLVRVLEQKEDELECAEYIKTLNRLSDLPLSDARDPVNDAYVRADNLRASETAMAAFSEAIEPGQTIRRFLDRAASKKFLDSLPEAGVIYREELTKYRSVDGITPYGKQLIELVICGAAIGDEDTLRRAWNEVPGVLRKMGTAWPAVIKAGPGTSKLVREALECHVNYSASNDHQSIRKWYEDIVEGKQAAIEEENKGRTELSEEGLLIAEFVERKKRSDIKKAFGLWATVAKPTEQLSLLCGPRPPTFEEIFRI